MEEAVAVRLTYYGHSSFLLEAADGTRVILDPYRAGSFNGALRYGAHHRHGGRRRRHPHA